MKRWWFAMQIFRVFFQLENSLVSCFCQECLPNDTSASQLSKHIFLSTEAFWSVILNTAFYLIKKNCFSIDSCAQYFPNLLKESIGWNRHHLLLVSTRKIRVWAVVVVDEFFFGNWVFLQRQYSVQVLEHTLDPFVISEVIHESSSWCII